MRRPTVVLADDHEAIRFGVRVTLEQAGFRVLADVADGPAAVRAAFTLRPDLVVLDVRMPGGGIPAAVAVRAKLPATRIVMLSAAADEGDVLAAVRAGADGYLLKDMDARRLGPALHGVLGGEAAIPRDMVARLLTVLRRADPPSGADGGPQLTLREAEVLEALRGAWTTAEIAADLDLSAVTIRRHVSGLLHKFGVANRAELIAATRGPAAPRALPPGSGFRHAA